MKFLKIYKNPFLLLASCLLLVSCGKTETKPQEEQEKTTTEESAPTIASLTAEQIKTVDIQFGTIEQKQLTATLRVNGALRVPTITKPTRLQCMGGL